MKTKQLVTTTLWIGISMLFAVVLLQPQNAYAAATAITIATVDYEEEEVVVNNNGNSKILFASEADAAKGIWEQINADAPDDTDPNNIIDVTRIDFSWLSKSTDNTLVFRGGDDSSKTNRMVELPRRTTKLNMAINYTNIGSLQKSDTIAPLVNIMSTAGTGKEPIHFVDLEWKKGDGGKWKPVSDLTVGQLEKFQIKGTDLYFRLKAVNDETTNNNNITSYPDGLQGRRASTETKLKIAKKSPSMVVGIDGAKFTADIKYGKEYKVAIDAQKTNWIKVDNRTVKNVSLVDIAKAAGTTANGYTLPLPAMELQIRSYATSKAAASKITKISLDSQRVLDGAYVKEEAAPKNAAVSDKNIYVAYTGNKDMTITIPSASSSNAYEYTVIKPIANNGTPDLVAEEKALLEKLSIAKWTGISRNTASKISSTIAVDGATIYIRQKEVRSKAATKNAAAVGYQLASTVVSYAITYPSVPKVETVDLTYVKGMTTTPVQFTVSLNRVGSIPFETKIRNIKLGTREINFIQELNHSIDDINNIDISNEYIITVTLDSSDLETMANTYAKLLTINFENGSADKVSARLTVKNPTNVLTLTSNVSIGSVAGTTKINVVSAPGIGNIYGYYFSTTAVDKVYAESLPSLPVYTEYNSGDNITATPGYLVVLEINPSLGTIAKFICVEITANEIAQ